MVLKFLCEGSKITEDILNYISNNNNNLNGIIKVKPINEWYIRKNIRKLIGIEKGINYSNNEIGYIIEFYPYFNEEYPNCYQVEIRRNSMDKVEQTYDIYFPDNESKINKKSPITIGQIDINDIHINPFNKIIQDIINV